MLRTKQVAISIPGWLSVVMEPNEAERRAAWTLYVQLSTRVATQPFNPEKGSLRAALSSMHELFKVTRVVLIDAGPVVAHSSTSLGTISLAFLTQILAPFLVEWHERLLEHEAKCPANVSEINHERSWADYERACRALEETQRTLRDYTNALADIADVTGASL